MGAGKGRKERKPLSGSEYETLYFPSRRINRVDQMIPPQLVHSLRALLSPRVSRGEWVAAGAGNLGCFPSASFASGKKGLSWNGP